MLLLQQQLQVERAAAEQESSNARLGTSAVAPMADVAVTWHVLVCTKVPVFAEAPPQKLLQQELAWGCRRSLTSTELYCVLFWTMSPLLLVLSLWKAVAEQLQWQASTLHHKLTLKQDTIESEHKVQVQQSHFKLPSFMLAAHKHGVGAESVKMWCRSWQASSEQLQWQAADMQRKLTDAEQRCTLWARRAGAAEARLPLHAIAANTRLKLPEQRVGLYGTTSWDPNSTPSSVSKSQNLSHALSSISKSHNLSHALSGIDTPQGVSHVLPGTMEQTADDGGKLQQEHEDGCALAMLQEALSCPSGTEVSGADGQWVAKHAKSQSEAVGNRLDGTAAAQAVRMDASLNEDDSLSPASLKERMAELQVQSKLALRPLSRVTVCDNDLYRVIGTAPDSPLKQRIAEYNSMIQQQLSSPRISAVLSSN